MDLLYQHYFGLNQAPFNITPDPGFLYLSASHREGLAHLSYGVKARKGFVVLTGEVGTGKTTLIHTLLTELDGNTQTALIFSAIVSPIDLLRYVCDEFGLTDPKQSRTDIHDYLVLLNEYLLDKYRKGENCVLIIDEAQNLSAEVLESIRLLSNFETSKDKLLQILLVGQPELSNRLNSQELRQLKQRITLRHHLRALSAPECQEYIANRLRVADGDPGIFSATALAGIYAYSKGIPRIINVLGDNALLTAYALGKKQVDDSIIREVAEDLSLSNGFMNVRPVNLVSSAPLYSGPTSPANKIVELPPVVLQAQRVTPITSRVEAAATEPSVVEAFFHELKKDLTEAMGPMASIVLQDNIRRLGQSMTNFPQKKLPSLIESVSNEILDPIARQWFCKAAFDRARESGA